MPANKNSLNQKIGKIIWRCPSNIAIVKYWGKKEGQIPSNSSLSMTLSHSFTEIELDFNDRKTTSGIELDYFFENKKNAEFENRVRKYLDEQSGFFPVLNRYAVRMNSRNSFPHSAGIASSASAFGAVALSLLDASFIVNNQLLDDSFFRQSSELARKGSGSACRSMYSGFVLWGKNEFMQGSSNEFAVPVLSVHDNFKRLHNAILIVDNSPKKISSSIGHSLMDQNVYAKSRFAQANERTSQLIKVLANGDFEEFIKIAESEALTLHAMMMTSENYYLLMKPGTLSAINKITTFRKETGIPVCFTLDAGPNVHLLYPEADKNKVEYFIKNDMKDNIGAVIFDKIGMGPQKIK
ncbi:MAG: hypothetical protein ABI172_05985 [Ginsengibacter sp.]